ncbi:MAG: lipopolysaccharide biosynthesis protein [Phototrophicaceae bacterium]
MIPRIQKFLQQRFVKDTLTLQVGKVGVLAVGLLGSIIVPVAMGPSVYGAWQLILTLHDLWQNLNLTGLAVSAQTRLGTAVGEDNPQALQRIMAVYVRGSLLYCVVSSALLAVITPLIASVFYGGDPTIPRLALILSLIQPTELLFQLALLAFGSQRQMRYVALLQNVNQIALVVTAVVAVSIAQTPQAMVIARFAYSWVTLAVAVTLYARTRATALPNFPTLAALWRAIPHERDPETWRFGLVNALDKGVAGLFLQLPVQMVGILRGAAAAGYLGLALNALRQGSFFTSALFDTMQAVIPQAVGRRDYVGLWRNFWRVTVTLMVGSLAFYSLFALGVGWVVPLIYGQTWLPIIPLLQVLALFGALTTIGSVFGPLYRAFQQVRGALWIKVGVLAIGLPVGYVWINQYGELGGAWLVNLWYALSVAATAWLSVPELRRRATSDILPQ